eukprot:Hpha_TRINITY_DN15904_c0_g2::TRINITY_DN15904_c0_g2_i2::g.74114::m.74114
MRRALGAVALCTTGVGAYMYDTFSPELAPPSACANGCDLWSNHGASAWVGGKVPADAGNKCAQVGSLVDSHTLGPWCWCSAAAPTPPSPTHPYNNSILALKNADTGKYVSFAYTAAPSGLAGSTEWMRDEYATNPDAMPLRFEAVEGQDNVYTLYNQWPSYEKYVSFTWSGYYLRSWYSSSDAMPVELQSAGNGAFYLVNRYSDSRGAGKYISLDSDTWLLAGTNDTAKALRVSLEVAEGPGAGSWDYCTHRNGVPEQVNVQIASPDSVVVSWVTFETAAPSKPPTVTASKAGGTKTEVQGVTHVHTTAAKDRTYYMHFVRLSGLEARAAYTYTVRSGGAGATESAAFTFRAPYASGKTKVDIYGDMGVYSWNNMQQLYDDCVKNQDADFIVHMGDHAYNQGDSDERRADGYFNAFQQTIASCPWMPVVGNHEYYAGAELGRYLDSTWDKWGPIAGGDVPGNEFAAGPAKSTATTALGALLSTGLHHGMGTMGANPSGTSRYFSADVGLIHIVALDLNLYYGVDPCGDSCKSAQLEWLRKDLTLANANRDKVPWVIALSHFPLYCSGCHGANYMPLYYGSDAAETSGNVNATAAKLWSEKPSNLAKAERWRGDGKPPPGALGGSADVTIKEFEPLFDEFALDLYIAGHWHYYESLWPTKTGSSKCPSCGEATQKSFDSPNSTIHVTTGNGGPPGKDTFCEDGAGAADCNSIPATRKQTNEYSYGRLTAWNATHLTFQQIFNANGSIFDEWTVVQPKHPFH